MKIPPENSEHLERLIHRTLRELPARRAPHSLEQRVHAELARRAALPWWRQGFAHWPLAARVAFAVLSAGTVKLVLLLAAWATSGFDSATNSDTLAQPVAWFESARTVADAIGNTFALLFHNIPTLWLYGGLAFCAAMYLALFGLGTAAYRTFQGHRSIFPS